MPITVYQYPDGAEVLTVELGEGDVGIALVVWDDSEKVGISFSPLESGETGREVIGDKKEQARQGVIFQVVSTSLESMKVLRDQIDRAIKMFQSLDGAKVEGNSAEVGKWAYTF
jgi:hypothetical protein